MRTTFSRFSLLLPVLLAPLASGLVACQNKPANDPNSSVPPNGYPQAGYNAQAGYPQQGYPQQYPNGAAPAGYPPAGQPGYPPAQQPGYPPAQQPYPGAQPAPGQQPPAANPLSSVSQGALDLVIQATAKVDAAGMDAEGAPITGTVTEGGHVDGLVNLSPGRCYTIIAAGAVNVLTRIDATLYAPPLFNVPAGSDSAGINAPAVIGKGGKALCPQVPFQIAYKLEITGKKGAGDVRAQLFSKAKK
jgi:hypothetical protein